MLDYGDGATDVSDPAPVARDERSHSALSPQAIASAILRRKGLVLALALSGAAAGYATTKLLTPRYVATAQIYLDPRGLPGLEKEDAASRQDSTGFINFVETQARILTSQVVLEPVVASQALTRDPEFGAGVGLVDRMLAGLFGKLPSAANPSDAVAGALRTLGSRITVRRPERTFIIEISATSSDPQKAARIANAVAQSYIDVRSSLQSDAAKQAAGSYSGRLVGMRERLLEAEKRIEDYKAEHGLVGGKDQTVDEQSLRDLNQQLTYARTRLDEAQSRFDQYQLARSSDAQLGALVATLNVQTLTNLRAQQSAAQEKYAELSADLGPRHPSVINAAARGVEIRRMMDAELIRIGGSIRKDLDRAKGAEEKLRHDVEGLRRRSTDAAQASVKLRDLEREVEASRSVYESYLARSRNTAEAQPIDISNTHIVTMAATPTTRSFPPGAALTTSAGLLLGFGAGAALALWREKGAAPAIPQKAPPRAAPAMEDAAREEEEASHAACDRAPTPHDIVLRHACARSVIAQPLVDAPAQDRIDRGVAHAPAELPVSNATHFDIRRPLSPQAPVELARLGVPVAMGAKEIRTIAKRLLARAGDGGEPNVVALCGDAPNDARTILAVNLALTLSDAGLAVALVDADRKEAVLGAFVDYASDAPLGGALRTRENILLALPRSGDAATRMMRALLSGRHGRLDIVLCDGLDEATADAVDIVVPVLGAQAAPRQEIGAMADKIAFVVRFAHADPWAESAEPLRASA